MLDFMKRLGKFPSNLELGTSSFCTTSCSICPYGKVENINTIMSDELFKKIIDECSVHKEVKMIAPFSMNDPFTDKKIIERIKYISLKCPKVKIILSTNGSLLTKNLSDNVVNLIDGIAFTVTGGIEKGSYEKHQPKHDYDQVMSNIDYFLSLLSKNDKRLKLNKVIINTFFTNNLEKEKQYWKQRGIKMNYTLPYVSRGGLVFKVDNEFKQIKGCAYGNYPKEFIAIQPDGKVILCCNDWLRENIIGDLNNQTIEEVWNSVTFNEYRKMIYGKKLPSKELICRKCDKAII